MLAAAGGVCWAGAGAGAGSGQGRAGQSMGMGMGMGMTGQTNLARLSQPGATAACVHTDLTGSWTRAGWRVCCGGLCLALRCGRAAEMDMRVMQRCTASHASTAPSSGATIKARLEGLGRLAVRRCQTRLGAGAGSGNGSGRGPWQ